ncbi:E3 ubiquitin-protein ligase RNF212B isoform X3 [Zonotrichia albicollis]|uniref:E3 ubiquitin-protein ligase RNF212B isoform X3 n=1 Tax=Zonotrichia albicollis TaxID=44394 RepID=UPI003D80E966
MPPPSPPHPKSMPGGISSWWRGGGGGMSSQVFCGRVLTLLFPSFPAPPTAPLRHRLPHLKSNIGVSQIGGKGISQIFWRGCLRFFPSPFPPKKRARFPPPAPPDSPRRLRGAGGAGGVPEGSRGGSGGEGGSWRGRPPGVRRARAGNRKVPAQSVTPPAATCPYLIRCAQRRRFSSRTQWPSPSSTLPTSRRELESLRRENEELRRMQLSPGWHWRSHSSTPRPSPTHSVTPQPRRQLSSQVVSRLAPLEPPQSHSTPGWQAGVAYRNSGTSSVGPPLAGTSEGSALRLARGGRSQWDLNRRP